MSNRMRMSGINSGMDTQSIVEQLVQVKSTKKDKLKKEQTKLGWKQDTWKSVNAKIFSLYNEQFGTLSLQGTFQKKKAHVVDSSIASVTGDANAVNGTHALAVKKLAKTAYLTGSQLEKDKEGNSVNVTGSTSIGSLLGDEVFTDSLDGLEGVKATVFKVKANSSAEEKNVLISNNMTMDEVAEAFSKAGLNASFDSKTNRFFISSKSDGKDGQFSITSVNGSEDLAARTKGFEEGETVDDKTKAAFNLLDGLGLTAKSAGKGYVPGQNAEIELNGASFESSTNLFQINGINITASKVSEKVGDEYVTTNVSVTNDIDGIYDSIKSFFKKYNEVINELDKLYNADAAKGYEPLTSEEKDQMSEDEVEEWEKKIKDSLLRRDDDLRSVISTLKEGMSKAVTLSNGNTYTLASFGVNTLSYWAAAENERGAFHIDGDSDDEKTKGNDDKLRAALTNNLDDTMNFFNKLTKDVYDQLGTMMTRVPDYRSFQSLYDDKMLQKEYDSYTNKIKQEEDYLSDYEDKWYDKFAAMEKAMEKVNSKSNALAGLFGTG